MVFIYWNKNGILDDEGEAYVIEAELFGSTGVDGKQVLGDVEVPAHAVLGNSRMRVVKSFLLPSTDPCEGSACGQSEG